MKNTALMSSIDMLDAFKNKHLCSDFKAAPLLGIGKGMVSAVRVGRTTFGDETGVLIAEELEIDPAYVLACLHAERATRGEHFDVAEVWKKAAAALSTAAIFTLFFSNLPLPHDAAAKEVRITNSVYYVK